MVNAERRPGSGDFAGAPPSKDEAPDGPEFPGGNRPAGEAGSAGGSDAAAAGAGATAAPRSAAQTAIGPEDGAEAGTPGAPSEDAPTEAERGAKDESGAPVDALSPEDDAGLAEGVETGEDASSEPEPEPEPETLDSLRAQLEEARREVLEERDAAVRARAEVENVRRRATRDVEQAHRFGVEGLVRELLPVRDGLELGSRAGQEEGGTVETLVEGTEMTLRMLNAALGKFGAVEVDPAGEDFDPRYHQAMSTREADGVESGKVVQVFQKGCVLHGRVVRPAMVIVSK